MKQVKKIVCALLLAAIVFAMPTVAYASEDGSMWLSTKETSENTTVFIATDTTVTDGLLEVTYDSSVLTYQDIEVSDTYVALYSVNAEVPGSVKISWVAPGAYESDGSGICLFKVNFSGNEEKSSVVLNGNGHFENGNDVPFSDAPDTTELEKFILEAESFVNAYRKGMFYEESYAELTRALSNAKNVFENPISSQKDIDDAAKTLNDAIEGLVFNASGSNTNANTSELEKAIAKAEGLDESKYTSKSFKDVKKELKDAKAVLSNSKASQSEVDAATKALNDAISALELYSEENPSTGIEPMMNTIIVMAVLSAAGIMIFGNKIIRRRA